MLSPSTIEDACTSVGVAKYGTPVGLEEKIKVDLIIIGSAAVDPKTRACLGEGEVQGFAELEYGMLRYMDATDDSMPVVTSVHNEQLVDDIPAEKLLVLDVPGHYMHSKPSNFYQHINSKASRNLLGQTISRKAWSNKNTSRTGVKLSKNQGKSFLVAHRKNYAPTAQRKR